MSECLNLNKDCSGKVEFYIRDTDFKQFSRCEFHQEKHENALANSVAAYSDSNVPPAWFDPGYAGERWDDDY